MPLPGYAHLAVAPSINTGPPAAFSAHAVKPPRRATLCPIHPACTRTGSHDMRARTAPARSGLAKRPSIDKPRSLSASIRRRSPGTRSVLGRGSTRPCMRVSCIPHGKLTARIFFPGCAERCPSERPFGGGGGGEHRSQSSASQSTKTTPS